MKKKLVFLTGAGMSVESGFKTFRGSDGLWENEPVERVATHDGWLADPNFVNAFYNRLRRQLFNAKPNKGHCLIAALQQAYDVSVITQNVDNLHERAGSTCVLHLHGELSKVCSSRDVDNPHFIRELTLDHCEVAPDEKAGDGSLLRPYIVFFQEAVPKISDAAQLVSDADIMVVVGTSLAVYPAAGLLHYVKPGTKVYLIDPEPPKTRRTDIVAIAKGASEGMEELTRLLLAQE